MFQGFCGAMGPLGWVTMALLWTGLIALVVWAISRLFPEHVKTAQRPPAPNVDRDEGPPRATSSSSHFILIQPPGDVTTVASRPSLREVHHEPGPRAGAVTRGLDPIAVSRDDGLHDRQTDS